MVRTSKKLLWAAFLGLMVLVACGGVERPELSDLPRPPLDAFESAVQEQLTDLFDGLEDLLGEGSTSLGDLASAYGELGRHLHVYELFEAAEVAYGNARRLDDEDFRWRYYQAVLAQTTGRLEEARERFEQAREREPDDLPTLVRLGQVYLDSGRAAAAQEPLGRALDLDPDCALALYFLGRRASSAGDFETAVAHFERVLELQPQASVLHYPLGQAYSGLGQQEKAERQLQLVGSEEVRLADPLMFQLEDLRAGAAAHIRRGARAQIDGAWDAALAEYRRAVETDPRNPEARQGVAAVLSQQGDYEGAAKQYEKALELGADNALVRFNLAGALALSGRPRDAIPHYEQVLQQDARHREAPFALARVLAQAGRGPEAIERLRALLETEPNSVRIHRELAALLADGGNSTEARALARRVLDLDASPQDRAGARLILAGLALREGRGEEAEGLYRRVIEDSPEAVEAHFGLANLLGAAGRFDQSAAAYRRVIELDPARSRARLGEATALTLAGRAPEARQRMEEGLRAQPNDGDLAHALARLLATSPQPEARDGARALELAEAVFEASRSLEHAETVAMALAESGRFDEAVQWQRRVVDGLRQAGAGAESLGQARSYLEKLERGEPIRQ